MRAEAVFALLALAAAAAMIFAMVRSSAKNALGAKSTTIDGRTLQIGYEGFNGVEEMRNIRVLRSYRKEGLAYLDVKDIDTGTEESLRCDRITRISDGLTGEKAEGGNARHWLKTRIA